VKAGAGPIAERLALNTDGAAICEQRAHESANIQWLHAAAVSVADAPWISEPDNNKKAGALMPRQTKMIEVIYKIISFFKRFLISMPRR